MKKEDFTKNITARRCIMHFLFLFGFWCFENIISDHVNLLVYACSTKNLADSEKISEEKYQSRYNRGCARNI